MKTFLTDLAANKQNPALFFHAQKQHPASAFFTPLNIQPKLTVNQAGDIYEQEADAVADKVMRMADPTVQTQPFFSPAIQRQCAHCEEEEKLQRKENTTQPTEASSETKSYINSLSSKGSPIPESTRSFFEPRFRRDFSDVKIHNDAEAAKSAQSINALAYTVGNNIVFNQNQFSPESDSGKQLLAHELTHVIQQSFGFNSIQKKDAEPAKRDNTTGWENDMESFSKVATEHYLRFDRNLLTDTVQSIQCSADAQTARECTVTTKKGIKVTVRWATDTKRVIVKSCISDDCVACGYSYSVDDKSNVIFEKIQCWIYAK